MTRLLSREELEAYQNVPLCDVHNKAWQEIIETALALYESKRALELILPMAIGYAATHQVGGNSVCIQVAREALRAFECEK